MSSRQRKSPGGAVDSRPPWKRSRLLPSSAGQTSQTEPRDLEQSGPPASEPEIIDLTGESSEPDVIVISDDESAVDMEQSQQQPHLFRASENSAEPVAKEDEEKPRNIDDDWLLFDFDPPYWSDEDSEGKEQDREQNQQPPHVSSATENSAGLLARDDEEKPRDVDGPRPAGPANPPRYEGDDSEGREPPHFFRTAENSAELPARDAEEEPRDDQGDWLLFDFDPPYWSDEDSEGKEQDREQNQQPPHVSSATENSAGLLARDDEEKPRDVDGPRPAGPANPPRYEGDDSEGREPPHFFRTAENSAELPARDAEEEPRDDQGDWLLFDFDPPYWSDEDSEGKEQDREQNQQPPHVSSATENSAGLLARDDEEKPRDVDGPRPAGPANPPRYEGDNSEGREPPHFFRTAENSAELPARDAEEEPRDDQGDWLLFDFDPPYWSDEDSEGKEQDREQNQQPPHVSSATENSAGLLARDDEEKPRDVDGPRPAGPANPPRYEGDDSEGREPPHFFRTAENSAELPARDAEEEPRDDQDDWLLFDFDPPYWSDEDSEGKEQDREQNQQPPHVSSATENSAGLLARDDEEKPRDVDGPRPAGPANPPRYEGDDSEGREPPHFFRTAENSAELPARDAEEEPRDDQGRRPDDIYNIRFWMQYYSEQPWNLRRLPCFIRGEDNSAVLVMRNIEAEQRDNYYPWRVRSDSPQYWSDEDSELPEVYGQEMRYVTPYYPDNDAAPSELGSEEEDTQSSDEEPGVFIRCPICLDDYSQVLQRGGQLMTTMCGHVFCSRCLPAFLETASMCPACGVHLSPELHVPVRL